MPSPPDNPTSEVIIGRVAKLRFGGGEAKREFDEAVRIVEEFNKRDEIETAMNGVRAADSDAYFYAGVAWGITLASCRLARNASVRPSECRKPF